MENVSRSDMIELADAIATQKLGIELGTSLPAGTTILLTGDLGSGKTTFVQGLARGLGIDEPIVSPTFTIINEYLTGRVPLYHLDLYRLPPAEVDALNLESYWLGIEFEPGIMAIEWADRMSYQPPHYLQIDLTYHPAEGRRAIITKSEKAPAVKPGSL